MSQDLVLTSQQLEYFRVFGFLQLPGLMADCIGEITDAFEAVFTGGAPGSAVDTRHDGTKRTCLVPFIDQHERLCALLDDPRIHGLACSIMGQDFNYVTSDGNYYTGDTAWHSDGWHADRPLYCKIAFYLDPLTRDTGALRVIPGSHHTGDQYGQSLQTRLWPAAPAKPAPPVAQGRQSAHPVMNPSDSPSLAALGVEGRDVPSVAIETRPGDVLIFNLNIKHAAYGGSKARRMFTINCSQRHPDNKLPDLQSFIASHSRFWLERMYGRTMVNTATPQRRRHLEQVMANDGHLAALSEKRRQVMTEPSRG